MTVSGQNFTPSKSVLISYYVGSTFKNSWTASVGCNGTFSTPFTPGVLDVGTGKVIANDAGGRNASKTFTIA